MKLRARWAVVLVAVTVTASGTGLALSVAAASGSTVPSGTRVYWDQNEEEDWLVQPGVQQPQPLVPAWDVNGQMAIFPDKSASFAAGYNPTTSSQVGNGGLSKPVKLPPVGEAIWNKDGSFSGKTLAVPGPYLGGDIPGNVDNPRDGSFNNNGTYVGAAFDPRTGNFFATDLGNAQGTVPPQDSGRLVEWFKAPPKGGTAAYSSYCILFGPTAGGTEPHHVDGTGGLRQPGTIAVDKSGNVLVPVLGVGSQIQGQVLQFAASSLPRSAASCPNSNENMPTNPVQQHVFINTSLNNQPTPQGIAADPTCGCWAVSSVLLGNAVSWYSATGTPDLARPSVPGESALASTGSSGYTPQGLAFAPDGTLYFADIHISCASSGGCGPANNEGQIMKVTFSQPGSFPSSPQPVNTEPLNFPVSVTACTPSASTVCPAPSSK